MRASFVEWYGGAGERIAEGLSCLQHAQTLNQWADSRNHHVGVRWLGERIQHADSIPKKGRIKMMGRNIDAVSPGSEHVFDSPLIEIARQRCRVWWWWSAWRGAGWIETNVVNIHVEQLGHIFLRWSGRCKLSLLTGFVSDHSLSHVLLSLRAWFSGRRWWWIHWLIVWKFMGVDRVFVIFIVRLTVMDVWVSGGWVIRVRWMGCRLAVTICLWLNLFYKTVHLLQMFYVSCSDWSDSIMIASFKA